MAGHGWRPVQRRDPVREWSREEHPDPGGEYRMGSAFYTEEVPIHAEWVIRSEFVQAVVSGVPHEMNVNRALYIQGLLERAECSAQA
jgi:hypothetical protein